MIKTGLEVSSAVNHLRAGHVVMDNYPLIVLANEPGLYRSLLAAELPFLRPNLRVLEVTPAELDAAVTALHPSVVICSQPSKRVSAQCSVLKLYCDELDTFIQFQGVTIVNPRLPDILKAIDGAVPPEHFPPVVIAS